MTRVDWIDTHRRGLAGTEVLVSGGAERLDKAGMELEGIIQLELGSIEGPSKLVVRLQPPPRTYGECEGKQIGCQRACRFNTGVAVGRERAGRRISGQERRILPLWNPALAGCALHTSSTTTGRDQQGNLNRVQVGHELGITREAVRQTEIKAIQKLKDSGQAEHLLSIIMGGSD